MYWSSSVVVVGAVKEYIPVKQGLKHVNIGDVSQVVRQVKEYIPVKQGLKRSCKMANKINY